MKYIIKEFKKLAPVNIFIFLIGLNYSIGLGLSLVGFFLLSEHMYSYGRWDIKDILGHENFGIAFLLIGLILLGEIISTVICLITYLLFCNYKWTEKQSPIKFAIKKLNG